jgi:hypothetical protein
VLFIGVAEQFVERAQQSQPALEGLGPVCAVTCPAADLVPVEVDVDRDVPGLDAHGRSIRDLPVRHIVGVSKDF